MDHTQYDKFIVFFSGGKDCTACFLHMLEIGIPVEKIELWHHEIDGREGSSLMDWEVTPAYCGAFADQFKVPIYFSWKYGGFEGEMLRDNAPTAMTIFEDEQGNLISFGGKSNKKSTRMKFPQVSADLSVRWCSAYLKIDVALGAIRNQSRFNGMRTCVVSGERGEESTQRSRYAIHEPSKADARDGEKARYIDHWRPARDKLETWVWDIICRWRVRVHVCYYLGWSRCSCEGCIFGDKNQWASAHRVSPKKIERIANYEDQFGVTIKRDKSVWDLIYEGTPYASITEELIQVANSNTYELSIIMDDWFLPAGAFKKGCGPS